MADDDSRRRLSLCSETVLRVPAQVPISEAELRTTSVRECDVYVIAPAIIMRRQAAGGS